MNIDLTECGNFVVTSHSHTIYLDNPDKGCLYYKDSVGHEGWQSYDYDGNITHSKNSEGVEGWKSYNEEGTQIYTKEIRECWYDDDGYLISKKEFDELHGI